MASFGISGSGPGGRLTKQGRVGHLPYAQCLTLELQGPPLAHARTVQVNCSGRTSFQFLNSPSPAPSTEWLILHSFCEFNGGVCLPTWFQLILNKDLCLFLPNDTECCFLNTFHELATLCVFTYCHHACTHVELPFFCTREHGSERGGQFAKV